MPTLAGIDGRSLVPNIGGQIAQGLGVRGEMQRQKLLGQQVNMQNQQAQQAQAAEARRRQLLGLPPLGQVNPQLGGIVQQQPEFQVPAGATPGIVPDQPPINLDQFAIEFPEEANKIATARKAIFDNQGARDKARIESVVIGAAEALASPNPLATLKARREQLAARGVPTDETDEGIAMFESGDIEGGTNALKEMVSLGNQLGILESSGGQGGLASAKTEILPGGTVIQALPSGDVQVRNAEGEIVTGQDRVSALNESRQFQLELAKQKANITVNKEVRTAAAKAGIKFETEPEIQAAITDAVANVKAAQKVAGETRSNDAVLSTYNVAMKGLVDSLAKTDTGPFIGLTPALTSNQQIADGAIAAMAPILKSLFRGAGEGTFTDKDQELLLQMVPTRSDTPKARQAKIQNIDAIVRAKLGSNQPQPAATNQTPAGSTPQVIKFNRDGQRIE